jgi:hypothetical protein
MALNLREEFEKRNGKLEDKVYDHILQLALDDQKQYITLSQTEMDTIVDPGRFAPSTHDNERLNEIRERLLESMGIIADIVTRRKLQK